VASRGERKVKASIGNGDASQISSANAAHLKRDQTGPSHRRLVSSSSYRTLPRIEASVPVGAGVRFPMVAAWLCTLGFNGQQTPDTAPRRTLAFVLGGRVWSGAPIQRQAAAGVSGRWVDDRLGSRPADAGAGGPRPDGTALAGLAQRGSRSPLTAGIIGAGRSWTACTISVLSMPRKYTDVTPRSACPSWRRMTTSGTPSRDISTA
jgi:hypothetical protein